MSEDINPIVTARKARRRERLQRDVARFDPVSEKLKRRQ